MNKFVIAIDALDELKTSMQSNDIEYINDVIQKIAILENKYEKIIRNKLISERIETIRLSDKIHNIDDTINSSNAEYIVLDIGTYKDSLKGSYLNRVVKLIMRNDPDRNPLSLDNLTSLKAIDIIWDLKQSSNRKSLFDFNVHGIYGYKLKLDITVRFINTTDLIPGKSTIRYSDILQLEYLRNIATDKTKHLFDDDVISRNLGNNITKLSVLWFDHPNGEPTALGVEYFHHLTWLDVGDSYELYGYILEKLQNLETLIIMIYFLNEIKNELPRLSKLRFLKLRAWPEDDISEYLSSIEWICKCKTLERLYLREPMEGDDADRLYKFESMLASKCSHIHVVYYDEKPF